MKTKFGSYSREKLKKLTDKQKAVAMFERYRQSNVENVESPGRYLVSKPHRNGSGFQDKFLLNQDVNCDLKIFPEK